MLPPLIPLFPLPNVVLFPEVFLPLHIFEDRYRAMIRDALAGDRMIGMVLLKPGWQDDYDGTPDVYPVGCTGLITHVERLEDGRYNIVLRGVTKFRVLEEDRQRVYRRAQVETLTEALDASAKARVRGERERLESLLAMIGGIAPDARFPDGMPDEDLINALAQYLDLEPVEKQALLEQPGLVARSSALIELLEMKSLASRHAWGANATRQ
jgi:uncharacterized protein